MQKKVAFPRRKMKKIEKKSAFFTQKIPQKCPKIDQKVQKSAKKVQKKV